jgi:hypothetical protein
MANTPVSARTVSEALHWRYATKRFGAGRKIPDETWTALGLAAMGYTAVCAGAAGYRSSDDGYALSRKVQFKADEVIIHV